MDEKHFWKSEKYEIDLKIIEPSDHCMLVADLVVNDYMKPYYVPVMNDVKNRVSGYELCVYMETKGFCYMSMQEFAQSFDENDEYSSMVFQSTFNLIFFKLLEVVKELCPKYFTELQMTEKYENFMSSVLSGGSIKDFVDNTSEIDKLKTASLYEDSCVKMDEYKDSIEVYNKSDLLKTVIEFNEWTLDNTKRVVVDFFMSAGKPIQVK